MNQHEKINYIEFPALNLSATKSFFSEVFAWHFEDYGPGYCAFSNAGVEGGFYQASVASDSSNGAALVVLYSKDLEATQAKVEAAGGTISKVIFAFPGGRRFHFKEPSGNELAVWSDVGL